MDFMFDAPVLMAVATVRPKARPAGPETSSAPTGRTGWPDEPHMSAGLALMSYLLKGEDLGLGSCILSAPLIFLDEPEEILGLEEMELTCFITTGYPPEEPPPPQEEAQRTLSVPLHETAGPHHLPGRHLFPGRLARRGITARIERGEVSLRTPAR